MNENPFEVALGIEKPWKVIDTQLISSEKNPERQEMHIYVSLEESSTLTCPVCGKEARTYDEKERVWDHLYFFQYRCYIHARVPRILCSEHGVKTLDVPWGKSISGFTLI